MLHRHFKSEKYPWETTYSLGVRGGISLGFELEELGDPPGQAAVGRCECGIMHTAMGVMCAQNLGTVG